ncbi:MAG: hypothetical protein ABSA41_02330, partial [Terriglobia bacterium]
APQSQDGEREIKGRKCAGFNRPIIAAQRAQPPQAPKRPNRPTLQPKTQASIDDQHSEAILRELGEKSGLATTPRSHWTASGRMVANPEVGNFGPDCCSAPDN